MVKELESHKLEGEKQVDLQYYVFSHRAWDSVPLCGIGFKFILAFPLILLCRAQSTWILKDHLLDPNPYL